MRPQLCKFWHDSLPNGRIQPAAPRNSKGSNLRTIVDYDASRRIPRCAGSPDRLSGTGVYKSRLSVSVTTRTRWRRFAALPAIISLLSQEDIWQPSLGCRADFDSHFDGCHAAGTDLYVHGGLATLQLVV